MPVDGPPCTKVDESQTPPETAVNRVGDLLKTALSRQRADWLQGIRVPVSDRLKACKAVSADPFQAAELIYCDFELRRDAGERPDWDGLLREFPEYATQLRNFRQADEFVEGVMAPSHLSARQLANYDLLQEVGRGGMGIVYRARERVLGRTVAIKRVRGAAFADDDLIQRSLNEAKAVSRLNHPNIVQIYRVNDCGEEPFIALEFVEGPTLAERIGGTPLAPRSAGMIVAAIARAIQHAHEHGIVHRDIKAANILLSGPPDNPVPKVTDFGAARELALADDAPRTRFLGTPSYIAPEQVESRFGPVCERTDVYGIGTVLYEALTGRPPFRADSIGETLRQVTETEPVSPRLLNPAVPPDLETVCLKCLHKQPWRRYDSAAALADDLERFLLGKPILARPVGPATRAWMLCRRKPGLASLVAVLLLSLMGGIAGITLQWRRAETERKTALANAAEAHDLLIELIQSHPVVPGRGASSDATIIESLQKAEAHCRASLQKDPDNRKLRIALTDVYQRLGSLYLQRGQAQLAEASLRQAQDLWEPLASEDAGDAECRYWLALTMSKTAFDMSPQFFQSEERAEGILQKLADEQPRNFEVLHNIWTIRNQMANSLDGKFGRERWLTPLEESRNELERRVRRNPADRPTRKRLALRYVLLGELSTWNEWTSQAATSWRKSYECYRALAHERPDDFLDTVSLAMCCSRLIQGGPSDPYYLEALSLLEQADRRLKSLTQEMPAHGWLRDLLLKNYCCLALCHIKAGQASKAIEASNNCLNMIATRVDKEGLEFGALLQHAQTLMGVAHRLRQAGQTDAARTVTRQVAALCSELARDPWPDVGFFHDLGKALDGSAALANQLGESALSLQQAKLCRRACEEWLRHSPEGQRHEEALGDPCMRIGKAHWSAGRQDQALAAFRESAAIFKRAFEREPSNPIFRTVLSQAYDRLVFYGSRAGELRLAADAILERTRLWPGDAKQQAQSAEDFETLAEQVATRRKGQLSIEDRAERDRYLAKSRKFRQAAEEARRRMPHDDLRVER
jgi:tetratricopeptide (TPR) repeat protein